MAGLSVKDLAGGEMKMSLYGRQKANPVEEAGLWKNVLMRQSRIRDNHLAIKGDNSSHWPGLKKWTRDELTERRPYYGINANQPLEHLSTYDRLFHIQQGYNCKLHRDDRKHMHTLGVRVHTEEMRRSVPLMSSSYYGLRLDHPLETFDRTLVRVDHVLKGFFYNHGTGLPPIDN